MEPLPSAVASDVMAKFLDNTFRLEVIDIVSFFDISAFESELCLSDLCISIVIFIHTMYSYYFVLLHTTVFAQVTKLSHYGPK